MVQLRPSRGGFLRPFGAAWFIREFLAGRGPYGSEAIDPGVGAPQTDIHAAYKAALHRAIAEDAVAMEVERRARAGEPPMTPKEMEARTGWYLERIPSKLTRMRYHSFTVYFDMLKRLGWVEATGEEEPSTIQEPAPGVVNPRGKPRIYYRLTARGRRATAVQVSNPLRVLYPHFDAAYFRAKRKGRRYFKWP